LTSIPPAPDSGYDCGMRWYPYAAAVFGLLVFALAVANRNWPIAALGALVAFFNLTKIFRVTRLFGIRLGWVRDDA